MPGTPGSIEEPFVLEQRLGTGGMGSVWRARHARLGTVAVKLMDPHLGAQPHFLRRFEREARVARQIDSPHVARTLDHGVDPRGRPYIAMELLEGIDLAELLKRRARLTVRETALFVSQACEGLALAHTRGVVHRDLKPENFFVCPRQPDFQIKILDFGVAKELDTEGETQSGVLIGSPLYMSPEQAQGLRTIDHRADLYSLACVAYHCLAGRVPFANASFARVLVSVCVDPIPPITSLRPDLPRGFDDFFARALAKKPSERFASATEFAVAFCTLDEGPVSSEPLGDAPTAVIDLKRELPGFGPLARVEAEPISDEIPPSSQVEETMHHFGDALTALRASVGRSHAAAPIEPRPPTVQVIGPEVPEVTVITAVTPPRISQPSPAPPEEPLRPSAAPATQKVAAQGSPHAFPVAVAILIAMCVLLTLLLLRR